MDFRFSDEDEAFRKEVANLIKSEVPPQFLYGLDEGIDRDPREAWEVAGAFRRKLAERKWLVMAWPEEYGGLAASYTRQAVFRHEMAYYGAPGDTHGAAWIGPSMIIFGSDEQKRRYLPGIASGEDWWCTLYSEPGAGSDLAGLQTMAIRDGDEYVVNGQKIWTSGGHYAKYGWLAARSDPDAPKHRGISLFAIDMHSPGVTVERIHNIVGNYVTNQMFFGFNRVTFKDVRVPAENLVGEENRGWYHLAVALDIERSGVGSAAMARRYLEQCFAFAQEHPEFVRRRPSIRHELAERWIETQVAYSFAYRIVGMQEAGIVANTETSISKLFGADLGQRVARTGLALVGQYGTIREGHRSQLQGYPARDYLRTVQNTIGGGTNEVQRGIIAQRGLGMPKG